MATKQLTSKEYFRILNILYFALFAGQVLFGVVILGFSLSGETIQEGLEFRDVFTIIVPLFFVGGIYGSHMLFKNKLIVAKNKSSLFEKMADYRSALIARWALLEFPSFFSMVVCFWTGDLFFLVMAALILVYFISIRPSIEKTEIDLELDISDKITINNPDAVIAEIDTTD
jgi:hypothetical protein